MRLGVEEVVQIDERRPRFELTHPPGSIMNLMITRKTRPCYVICDAIERLLKPNVHQGLI